MLIPDVVILWLNMPLCCADKAAHTRSQQGPGPVPPSSPALPSSTSQREPDHKQPRASGSHVPQLSPVPSETNAAMLQHQQLRDSSDQHHTNTGLQNKHPVPKLNQSGLKPEQQAMLSKGLQLMTQLQQVCNSNQKIVAMTTYAHSEDCTAVVS